MAKTESKTTTAKKPEPSKKKLGAAWIRETESTIEELRHTRAEIRRRIREQACAGDVLAAVDTGAIVAVRDAR